MKQDQKIMLIAPLHQHAVMAKIGHKGRLVKWGEDESKMALITLEGLVGVFLAYKRRLIAIDLHLQLES